MSGFDRKNLENGDANPKYIDLCDEDPPIAGQKFACLSFVSPEKILKKRENYIFEQFLKQWEFSKCMEKSMDFLNFLAYKYHLKIDDVMADFTEFVKDEDVKMKASGVDDDFKTYMEKNEDKLNEQFQRAHGVFPTQEEAEMKCKKLREVDPNHDIFVGPVGMWIPWDPDAYKTGRIEFMEEELNQLHHEKLKNETKAKEEFERRVKETKQKAIKENIELAKKSGNVLTQTLNEDGQLIGVKETVDFESREVSDAAGVNLRNELLRESVVAGDK